MKLDLRVRSAWWHGAIGGFGLDWFPYQLAIGVSVRVWETGPAFRLYVGPAKAWGYLNLWKSRREE